MANLTLFKNNRNGHKFIELKKYDSGNYYWRQLMIYDNGVVCYVGSPRGSFSRITKRTFANVLNYDYTELDKHILIK